MPVTSIARTARASHLIPPYTSTGDEIAVFELAYSNRLPVLIKGPTGCGKTRFVEHMAARLGRPLYTVSCHDDLSASDLVGRHLIDASGTYWTDGPLTQAVRHGGICYLDEVVEARKDTTVVLHALSDDRRILPIDRTGEILEAPPEFMLVVSYNPGYQHLLKSLKPSTRQRFVSLAFSFPDAACETEIVVTESGVDRTIAKHLVTLANALRKTSDHDLEEAPGTRLIVDAAKLIANGCDPLVACRAAVVECLSDDPEVTKALMVVVLAIFGN
ncbi:denitrification regulatory protein NirQ [mine drainage metagenome]|uniref:Denitrification regulatory protein NirQ n=1 Tax=mine drainage metagenome TaxID=410659 RepID=A0A1J5Q0Y6_9ZZZZ